MSDQSNVEESALNSNPDLKIRLSDLPPSGYRAAFRLSEANCNAVAERLGKISISDIFADLSVTKAIDAKHYNVFGTVNVKLVQTCVVTLDPLEQDLVSRVDLKFEESVSCGDIEWDVSGDVDDIIDPPERVIGGVIDLGDLIVQQIALDLEPFPRSPNIPTAHGSTIINTETDNHGPNPFHQLAELRDKLGG
ncbi:MAG: hypothetical protein CBB68_03825 [Rhodospirillaceae bacterium TMED8]|nr:hypothetical protein [Magnetovibrio sp.]OUT52006.1 MAG: hypothetical protein CBB68_03825 [Rhodospirillaceae bacterium TMED8]|tara:strand:+ start:8946 stop:9524 length:579 start_codon:yes stop_codon:yes gene_type:complete